MQRDPRWKKVYCTAQNESFVREMDKDLPSIMLEKS